jgi:manganese/zinc/iron transport system permease protein
MSYALLIVIVGTAILGGVAGGLGCFAVLRRQSLLGDAISHAALPGICVAFLCAGGKHPLAVVMGAMIAGWLGAMILTVVTQNTVLTQDSVLGIVLSVFFGFGLVMLTLIQRLPLPDKSGLNQYLFGSAATLLKSDIYVMLGVGSIALFGVVLFWKEFKLISFDPGYALALGYRVDRIVLFLTMLIVMAIVIGLQTVGVILMSTLVIAPAVAARQWTNRLSVMVIGAIGMGSLSGLVGSVLSQFSALPTGPMIVVVMSIIVMISLLLAPNRGIITEKLRHDRNRSIIHQHKCLAHLWTLAQNHTDLTHAHAVSVFEALGYSWALASLKRLLEQGLVYQDNAGFWGLTTAGIDRASETFGQIPESGQSGSSFSSRNSVCP